jgi:hypothetical protein
LRMNIDIGEILLWANTRILSNFATVLLCVMLQLNLSY